MEIVIEYAKDSSFFNEIILLIIGALIGFLSSVGTIIVQRILDRKGKLNIFYKNTLEFTLGSPGGIKHKDNKFVCSIPLYIELQNTSDSTRVIRDLCLLIYNKGKKIDNMIQISSLHTTKTRGNDIVKEEDVLFGSEKSSYSFVLLPRSIQRQQIWFEYINEKDFTYDEIKIRYFDEKNKEKIFSFMKIENCREIQNFRCDNEWNLVKK